MRKILLLLPLLAVALAAAWGVRPASTPADDQRMAFTLQPPVALAQSSGFPIDEAGPMAYVRVRERDNFDEILRFAEQGGGSRDLSVDKIVQSDGRSYVLLSGYFRTNDDVLYSEGHLYADINGWRVAFTSPSSSLERLVDWRFFSGDPKFEFAFNLISAVYDMTWNIGGGVNRSEVKIFHPQMPQVSKVYIAGERGSGEFTFLIPDTLHARIVESVVVTNSNHDDPGSLHIDGKKVADINKRAGGQFATLALKPNTSYRIHSEGDNVSFAIVIGVRGDSGR